jgi:hypothetical protein
MLVEMAEDSRNSDKALRRVGAAVLRLEKVVFTRLCSSARGNNSTPRLRAFSFSRTVRDILPVVLEDMPHSHDPFAEVIKHEEKNVG